MIKHGYDVIIIGGGPAGLTAAEELAKNKKSVLLLEKNKEIGPKVCAGGITTKINKLGIPLSIIDKQFSSFIGHASYYINRRSLPQPFMFTVDRKRLGQYLAQRAISAGAIIQTNTLVIKISTNSIMTDNQKIQYKYLIGADGSLSMTRKYLGIPTKKVLISFQYLVPKAYPDLEIHINTKLFGSGYGWIFPHRDFTSIGILRDKKEACDHNLKKQCTRWCDQINIDLQGTKQESWLVNYDYQGWQFENIFLVGDAGGFASGLTGEGIYYAIISGCETAKKIINPRYNASQIDYILKKKNRHENFLKLLQLNKKIPDIIYNTIMLLTKSKFMTKKAVSFFFE